MPNEDDTKRFPEEDVDKLIADFGRPPKPKDVERFKDMIEAQRSKYEALDRAVKKANEPEKERKRGRQV